MSKQELITSQPKNNDLDFDYERDKHKKDEFDPIKVPKDGKQAEAVVWSTSVLERAVEGINKGLPLKANPFIGKNTQLLKPDLVYKRTPEEVEEYIRCMKDPVYFAEKCYLMTPTGMKQCKLRDYQEAYIRQCNENRFNILLAARQSGKCFIETTNIIIRLHKRFDGATSLCKLIPASYQIGRDGDFIYYKLPFYLLYNIIFKLQCREQSSLTAWLSKLRCALYKMIDLEDTHAWLQSIVFRAISYLDRIDYLYIKKQKLLDNIKVTEHLNVTDYRIDVLGDDNFYPLTHLYKTKPYLLYYIETDNGHKLYCADKHRVFTGKMTEIYVEDIVPGETILYTIDGPSVVTKLCKFDFELSMCDLTVEHETHRFFTNGILSHNSVTTAIIALHKILFNTDKRGLVLSKSGPAGVDLLSKIKDMYRFLPYYLKPGVLKWNQTEIAFDNNSSMSTEPFSPTAGLGKTINFLILDEFAWCPPNDVELFYNNIIPTVTSDTTSNICIMSTQNGFNLFYKIYTAAIKGENIYKPMKVDWDMVPMWDGENKCWKKRDQKWKDEMVGVLGSEENFQYQYGTMFVTSDNCIVSREKLSQLNAHANPFVTLNNSDYYTTFNDDDLDEHKHILYHSLYNKYFFIKKDYQFSKDKWYIILVDLAEGVKKDYTVFNILEITGQCQFEQVARWTSNEVDIENASLEFWLMVGQVFNPEKTIFSIELNTYGALFYLNLISLNEESDISAESNWRFKLCPDGLDTFMCVRYPKNNSIEDNIPGIQNSKSKSVPGIKMTRESKKTACAMLKGMLNKDDIKITDLTTVIEIQNFEDKNNNGSYQASYGHDDIIMTFVQLPLLLNTNKYQSFMEDYAMEQSGPVNQAAQIVSDIYSGW